MNNNMIPRYNIYVDDSYRYGASLETEVAQDGDYCHWAAVEPELARLNAEIARLNTQVADLVAETAVSNYAVGYQEGYNDWNNEGDTNQCTCG